MNLYLIRHGIAEEVGDGNEFTDEKRSLTTKGRSRMREAARGLRNIRVAFDVVLTSPLLRAVQTTEIIQDILRMDKSGVRQTANLSPGARFEPLFEEIGMLSAESVALVGHQPDLGDLLSTIVSGSRLLAVDLKKGGVCCIAVTETVPAIRGFLAWLLTPRQLRELGRL